MSAENIRAMSEQLAADPGSLVFLPLAEALLARGDLLHAARVARRGAERHAGRADALDLVARIALEQGDLDGAETAWQQALAYASESGAAHRGLGFLRYQQGHYDEAERHLAVARAASPGNPALEAAWAAVQDARQGMREFPTTPTLLPPGAAAAARASASSTSPAGAASLFGDALGDTAQVALLLDADGLVVAGRYETAEGEDLGAVIGAHLSGVSDEAGRAMRHFGLGQWTRIALESEGATIVMAPAGKAIALVAAPKDVPLGFVRRTLAQCVARAGQWLAGGG